MGVPFAVALGLLVAILDLIPLAGATLAGIIVVTVSFLHSVPAGIVLLVFIDPLPAGSRTTSSSR